MLVVKVSGWKTEDGSRKTEDRSRKSEDRRRKSEDISWKLRNIIVLHLSTYHSETCNFYLLTFNCNQQLL